ncbi:unnamed protein product [Gordionus sp. m RMFG-2023]
MAFQEFDPLVDCPCYDKTPRCGITAPKNCTAGLVYDRCRCCKICGKTKNQRCEGRSNWQGTCGKGLYCLHDDDDHLLNYPGKCAKVKN